MWCTFRWLVPITPFHIISDHFINDALVFIIYSDELEPCIVDHVVRDFFGFDYPADQHYRMRVERHADFQDELRAGIELAVGGY